jgi:hypothetical protein
VPRLPLMSELERPVYKEMPPLREDKPWSAAAN